MLPMLGADLAGLERINTTYAGCRLPPLFLRRRLLDRTAWAHR
jgi:hypothetical protein